VRRSIGLAAAALLLPIAARAQLSAHPPKGPLVELELMTWAEVRQALADGTEQRGPQNANGSRTWC